MACTGMEGTRLGVGWLSLGYYRTRMPHAEPYVPYNNTQGAASLSFVHRRTPSYTFLQLCPQATPDTNAGPSLPRGSAPWMPLRMWSSKCHTVGTTRGSITGPRPSCPGACVLTHTHRMPYNAQDDATKHCKRFRMSCAGHVL